MRAHFHNVDGSGTCEHCPTATTDRCPTCFTWCCLDCTSVHEQEECEEPYVQFLKTYMSHYHDTDCPCGLTWHDTDCYCQTRAQVVRLR